MIEHQKFYEIINNNYLEPVEYDFNNEKNVGTKKHNQLSELKTTFLLLNTLGTDEINPFFFQLCDKLYDSNLDKLNSICELVLEFMIRYRIVQPSGGGGSLSNKIRTIMLKLHNGNCPLTKKSIYNKLVPERDEKALTPNPANTKRYPLTPNL